MKYNWNLNNYCTFKTFEINRLKSRSYFIPYASKEEAKGIDILDYRYKSSKVHCLNGIWDFKFYKNPNDFPMVGDSENITWDKIDVPSCVQMRGYDIPYYTNVKYQFRLNPPHIPTLKPVGWYFGMNLSDPSMLHFELHNVKDSYNFVCVYHRKFDIKDLNKDYTLRFFGVDPCYDLFVNGQFVGYAEGSHEYSDFDINKYIVEGENDLLLVVHRWCNGTYLEDQDMFRNNGIFRDVILFEEEKTRIWDFAFKTDRYLDKFKFNIDVDVINPSNTEVRATLSFKGRVVFDSTMPSSHAKFESNPGLPKLWNAETPSLYVLELELIKDGQVIEYVKKNVGFKKVEIKGDVFYFNNQKIKFKGVNHHDTDPKNGYTMSPSDILRDIKICKEYGINSIRTSHYPPDPLLIELADIYGLYIIAEADIETHGCNPYTSRSVSGRISNNLAWKDHFLDRAYRLYEPLKNDVCITMWSLGNESGGVACHQEMNKFFKSVTDIPVHLESAIHKSIVHYDVTSMMYPSIPLIHAVGSKTLKHNAHNDKMMEVPFFMCEYAHAMGVGPGCLEEYYDEVLQYDSLMGGCIWEFCDHAIYHEDGPYKYTYGGDHGEYFHDGNFCADGLFYPDRTPSSGALHMKYVYRPLRFYYAGNKTIKVFNTNNFIDASNYDIEFSLCKNDEVIDVRKLNLKTPPFTKELVDYDLIDREFKGNVYINIKYFQKNHPNIHFEEQIELNTAFEDVKFDNLPLTVKDTDNEIQINFKKGKISFSKTSGTITSYVLNGQEILANNTVHSLNRAHLDNDAYEMIAWKLNGLAYLQDHLKSITYRKEDDLVIVESLTNISKRFVSFLVKDTYIVHGDGKIEVESNLLKGSKVDLPRFGITYQFKDEFRDLDFIAREKESYVDFCNHTLIGHYQNKVDNMIEPNLRPQESGNRLDAKELTVSNGSIGLRFVAVDNPFEFGAKTMSDAQLEVMKHREDTLKYKNSYITLAHFNMGVGTGICGPIALQEYRYSGAYNYEFKYIIEPVIL